MAETEQEKASRKGGVVEVTEIPAGVPLYIEEGVVFRLRQNVLDIEEADITVACGAGVGGDFVTMDVGDHSAVFYLRDVLKAWVATFDPDTAERIPGTDFTVNFTPKEANHASQ